VRRAITSGTRLALVLACVAAAGGSAAAATKSSASARASGSQRLVVLLASHPAHRTASPTSKTVAVVPARTPITAVRTVLPLLAVRGRWLLVALPGRPNGHTGWISAVHTSRAVTFWHIFVRTAQTTVTVTWGGRPVKVFKSVVGKPSTPTPPGRFFVEETVALSPSAVGAPFALALSARSNVLQEFDGGPGQIGIHGLDNVGGTPGTADSHGCVRVTTAAVRWLAARIGPGVPVTISR
jgi:lipoprotein-anchoring transpeptidase ErfK/SrfK